MPRGRRWRWPAGRRAGQRRPRRRRWAAGALSVRWRDPGKQVTAARTTPRRRRGRGGCSGSHRRRRRRCCRLQVTWHKSPVSGVNLPPPTMMVTVVGQVRRWSLKPPSGRRTGGQRSPLVRRVSPRAAGTGAEGALIGTAAVTRIGISGGGKPQRPRVCCPLPGAQQGRGRQRASSPCRELCPPRPEAGPQLPPSLPPLPPPPLPAPEPPVGAAPRRRPRPQQACWLGVALPLPPPLPRASAGRRPPAAPPQWASAAPTEWRGGASPTPPSTLPLLLVLPYLRGMRRRGCGCLRPRRPPAPEQMRAGAARDVAGLQRPLPGMPAVASTSVAGIHPSWAVRRVSAAAQRQQQPPAGGTAAVVTELPTTGRRVVSELYRAAGPPSWWTAAAATPRGRWCSNSAGIEGGEEQWEGGEGQAKGIGFLGYEFGITKMIAWGVWILSELWPYMFEAPCCALYAFNF